MRGDTLAATGLAEAFAGATTVVHLAGGPKGDDLATANVAKAALAAGVKHVVLISVIGAGAVPLGYFRAKAGAERALAESGLGYSILRAAQFHDFLYPVMKVVAATPFVLAPRGMRFEPVDANAVAARLVELALGEPAGRVDDIAGPDVLDVEALARTWRAARGGSVRAILRMPLGGAVGRAYRAGDNLAGSDVQRTGESWAQNLGEQFAQAAASAR